MFEQAPAGMSLTDAYAWDLAHGLIDDGNGPDNTYTAPDWATDPNSEFNKPAQFQVQSNLDDWYAAHNGGARYAVYQGVTIDNAAIAYAATKAQVANGALPALGTGLNADLDAELAGAVAKASAAVTYGATHGGWTAENDPNAAPIVISDPNFVAVVPPPPAISDPTLPPWVIGDPLAPPVPGLVPTAAQATAGGMSPLVVGLVVATVLVLAWKFRGAL